VDAGEAFVGGDISQIGSGLFSFYEVSLLDSIELSALQSDSFRLATLAFYLPYGHTLASGSSINFSTANVVLSDDFGDELITGVNQGATVQFVPEPPIALLFLIGMIPILFNNKLSRKFDSKQSANKMSAMKSAVLVVILSTIGIGTVNAAPTWTPFVPTGSISPLGSGMLPASDYISGASDDMYTWYCDLSDQYCPPQSTYSRANFRQTFSLPQQQGYPLYKSGSISVIADDYYALYINDKLVGESWLDNKNAATTFDIANYMVLGQENVVDIFVCDGYKSSATAGQTAAEGLNACTNATSRGNHWLLVSGGFQVEYNTPGGEILKSVSFRSGEPSDWQVRADISQATKPCDGRDCFTYVGHRDHGEIDVIDATTNEIVDTIQVSLLGQIELAMTPNGSKLFAIGNTGTSSERLAVIDTQTNTETNTISLPQGHATSLAITPDGRYLYVAVATSSILPQIQDTLVIIDAKTDTTVQTISLGNGLFPDGLAFSPDGKHVYLTTSVNGRLLVLDTLTHDKIADLDIGSGSHYLAVTPNGKLVYIVNRDSNIVTVVNSETNQFIKNIATGFLPEGIAITPDSRFAYVSVFDSAFHGRLQVIDTATNTITKTVDLNGKNGPTGIAITPDGSRAYVALESDLVVSMVSIANNKVVAEIPIGTPTRGVALSGLPLAIRQFGDINQDSSIDKTDLGMLLLDLNKSINTSVCGMSCDLDGDGKITILDSRRLVTLCSKPKCATK
jgi:YVTN family beta-propeller protein